MHAPKLTVIGIGTIAAIISFSVGSAHAEEVKKIITVPHIDEIPGPDWSRPESKQAPPSIPGTESAAGAGIGESMAGMKTAPDAAGLPGDLPAAQPAPQAAPNPAGEPSSAARKEMAVARADAPAAAPPPAAPPVIREAPPAAPAPAAVAPAPQAPAAAAAPAPQPAEPPQGAEQTTIGGMGGVEPPYDLRITATARQVWVWVSIDGGPLQATSLDQGESASFEAKERYVLTVDDAGGVEATLNGKSLPSLGAPSQVKRKLVIPSPELAPVG